MKHLKKAEQRVSDTRGFLWVYAILAAIPKIIKILLLILWKHTTEIITAAALIGMILVYRALEGGALEYTPAVLFVGILAALIAAMIKIKILEAKRK